MNFFFSLWTLLRRGTTAGLEAVDTQNLSFGNKLLIFTRDILFRVVIATNLELRLCCFLSSVAFVSAFITILSFYSDPRSHLDNSMEMKMFMFASRVAVHVKSSLECFCELSENKENVFFVFFFLPFSHLFAVARVRHRTLATICPTHFINLWSL